MRDREGRLLRVDIKGGQIHLEVRLYLGDQESGDGPDLHPQAGLEGDLYPRRKLADLQVETLPRDLDPDFAFLLVDLHKQRQFYLFGLLKQRVFRARNECPDSTLADFNWDD